FFFCRFIFTWQPFFIHYFYFATFSRPCFATHLLFRLGQFCSSIFLFTSWLSYLTFKRPRIPKRSIDGIMVLDLTRTHASRTLSCQHRGSSPRIECGEKELTSAPMKENKK